MELIVRILKHLYFISVQRSSTTSSASRNQAVAIRQEKASQIFLDSDILVSFTDLLKQSESDFPSSWNVFSIRKADLLVLEEIALDDELPKLLYSIKIKQDFTFATFVKNTCLSHEKFAHITDGNKIKRFSDVHNIVAFLRHQSELQVNNFV